MTDNPTHGPSADEKAMVAISQMPCLACGYNLHGLDPHGYCPECGYSNLRTIESRRSMTKRELAALAFRIMSLWMVLGVIAGVVPTWSFVFREPIQVVLLMAGICASVLLISIVWWKADHLAKLAIGVDGPISINGGVVPEQIISIAIGIFGISYTVYGITNFLWIGVAFVLQQDSYPQVTLAAVHLVIGSFLLVGAGRIASFVMWLRVAGTHSKTESSTES
jgi:predicted RNA-binding Zn-ribbon protein involved in translation (DUF1610 family)